jgi:hypothetical protein
MSDKYRARISLGYFDSPEERDRAIDDARATLGGMNAQQRRELPNKVVNEPRISTALYDAYVNAVDDDLAADLLNKWTADDKATHAPPFPDNVQLLGKQPLTLDLDTFSYCCDLHAPLHNKRMLDRLVAVLLQRGIGDLIIGGDLFDFDSASRFPKASAQAGLNRTLSIGGDILYALASLFKLYVLPGNHCRRVAAKLDEPLEFESLIYAALRGRQTKYPITVTDYDYIYVNDKWVVGHPRFYSRVPAKGGTDVAMLQQRHVIGAHNHVQGILQSPCGRYLSIDPGHMTEPELTPYHMQSLGMSKFPAWQAGFCVVEENKPTLYNDKMTRWKEYGVD